MSSLFYEGGLYPPTAHATRIERYKTNKKLFLGDHLDVFNKYGKKLPHTQKELLYVSINLASIISKKSADFLFGEQLQVSVGKGDNSKEQAAIDRITENNEMGIKNYESALSNSYRGDSFYRLRVGQEFGGELPPELDEPKVIIDTQNAEYVFPETMTGDANKIKAYHIAVPERVDSPTPNKDVLLESEWILHVESHSAGKIEYSKFRLNPISVNRHGDVDQWKIGYEFKESRSAVATGVPFPLVVHVPNFGLDDMWNGIDDITEHRSILDEINNRITQISDILDKHADAPIAVPVGTLREDSNGNVVYNVAQEKVFEITGKDDVIPQYITNSNPLVDQAFKELEMLIDLLFTVSEIPSVALGRNDSGTSGSSGLSIKWRMNSLLSKINRKRQYYDKGLKRVYVIAQMLENAVGIDTYEVSVPKLKFKTGLPKDAMEEANIMAIRTGGKPTLSQRSAIKQMDDLTDEQTDAELEKMEAEKEAEQDSFVDESIFNEEHSTEEKEDSAEDTIGDEGELKQDNRFKN
ncbi:phage portal protein [Priestia megaterium]|uniref:phage portal protein n=1 Tax=Priestia megaterium TaxID=1404 RepID=UPI0023DA7BFC|nr:phage portal protein [Priestia megaterium]MDF2010205.1 phage portal protein [Priestia megaterium]